MYMYTLPICTCTLHICSTCTWQLYMAINTYNYMYMYMQLYTMMSHRKHSHVLSINKANNTNRHTRHMCEYHSPYKVAPRVRGEVTETTMWNNIDYLRCSLDWPRISIHVYVCNTFMYSDYCVCGKPCRGKHCEINTQGYGD